jgi:hypothetical protein
MWRRRNGRREPDRRVTGVETSVGDECEAFLAGQLGAYLHRSGRPISPAGWLNQLVHGTTNELALMAVGSHPSLDPSNWQQAMAYLARSLLERARDTGRPIGELQRELLLPLELELLGNPDAVDFDPADVIRLTLARLYELPELPA